MADIAKCQLEDCPRNEQCYRYTAPSSTYLQSYIVNPKDDCIDKDFGMQIPLNSPIVSSKNTMWSPRKDQRKD